MDCYLHSGLIKCLGIAIKIVNTHTTLRQRRGGTIWAKYVGCIELFGEDFKFVERNYCPVLQIQTREAVAQF